MSRKTATTNVRDLVRRIVELDEIIAKRRRNITRSDKKDVSFKENKAELNLAMQERAEKVEQLVAFHKKILPQLDAFVQGRRSRGKQKPA